MRIALKDIKSNPHRNLGRFPIDKAKVAQLVESINSTEAGFWDNVVVRKNTQGEYELAYGHHRLAAAIQAGLKDADFIVKKLSDADMLKIMVLENDNDRARAQVNVLVESIEALVNAIAAGTIEVELDPKTNKSLIKFAPSFRSNPLESAEKASSTDSVEHPYTVVAIATFLGKTRKSGQASEAIQAVIDALELVELKVLSRAKVEDAPTVTDLQQMVREGTALHEQRIRQKRVRQQEAEAEAKATALRKEAEEKRKVAYVKDEQARKEREANERELAEEIRLVQEERRQAETKAEKIRAQKAIEEVRKQQAEEAEREKERQRVFKEKKAKLDYDVEIRKQREQEIRDRNEERREAAEKEESVVKVDRKALGSVDDIVRKAKQWNELGKTIQEMVSQPVQWDDRLGLSRLVAEIEEGGRIQTKLWSKLQRKSPKG